MNIQTKSYPNPVLGNGDDYKIAIDDSIIEFSEISKDQKNFYITAINKLEDEIINNLIKEKKAAFLCEIDCVKTNFRTSKCEYGNKIEIEIPRYKIVDNVDIHCYIIATKPIEQYSHPNFHEFFEGTTFSLEEGDYIATLGSFFFNATVKYSKCPAPSSLMQVQEASSNSGITTIKFNTDEERIYIVMPHDMFEIYNKVCGQNTNADELFISTIAVDALSYALMTILDADTNLAANLRNLLDKNCISFDEGHPEQCIDAARKLLEEDGVDPYTTFMKKVESIIMTQNTIQDGDTE